MQRVTRNGTRFVGLDVHAETITVAIATKDGDVHTMGGARQRSSSISSILSCSTIGVPMHSYAGYLSPADFEVRRVKEWHHELVGGEGRKGTRKEGGGCIFQRGWYPDIPPERSRSS